MLRAFLVVAILEIAAVPGGDGSPRIDRQIDYEREVRPILAERCYACHGPVKAKGGLRLDRKTSALKGGDSGPVLVPGKGEESLIVQLTAGVEEDRVMPPKGQRLSAGQIAVLRAWIDQGADWPGIDGSDDRRNWWSLRPLARPSVPVPSGGDRAWVRNPIDAFVRAKQREKGLNLPPAPEADRRTLLRRLSFDLTGLPPSLEELEAFLNDPAPDAYERQVDRLLSSPHLGERWARHWLDVVHYGDTHGYDKDQPRPFAWPYRDYLIRSFNADRPYGEFVRQQIAGDVLERGSADGVIAMGFIAAGPWDFIGHVEVSESKIDGKVARHLDRDDMVSNTINTFLSLTIQCAQCHNHKFDPISQEDYYRLQAVFAALDRADRPYYANRATAHKAAELLARREALKQRQAALNAAVSKAAGPALVELDRKIAAAGKPALARAEFGYHSGIEPSQDAIKWVQVDLGRSLAADRVVLWGCHDDFNNIGDGFGLPVRYKVEMADDPAFKTGVAVIVDHTGGDVANWGVRARTLPARGARGRYLRVTASKLAPRQNDFIFALAELEVLDATGKNLARGAAVTALDTIEASPRWSRANLVDGFAPGQGPAGDLDTLRQERQALLARVAGVAALRSLAETAAELERVTAGLNQVQPTGLVYAGTIHNGGGAAFRGTGPGGGKPRPIFVLRRGDIKNPGPEVGPGALNVLAELPGTLDLSAGHAEGERRAALARWLTDDRNALTWRSIVNRVWQYHFGRGIVATPNDFGRMGQLPTHPELLDWLALEFRDGGQSLKVLHRLIVTSATYRQSAAGNPVAEAIDAGNSLLWRMNRRKLEAEAIRDAALAVAGKLDESMFGPGFQDFVIEHPEHSPHYEYELRDPGDPRTFRRAVYRFLVRSRPQPFMAALDCADPSIQVDRRNETGSPLQALALYNNGFMLTMARYLAARVHGAGGLPEQAAAAWRLALGRSPTATELQGLADHARRFGLESACRVMLNLSEFAFVD